MTTSAIIEKQAKQEVYIDILPATIGEILSVAKALMAVNPGPVLPEEQMRESSWSLRGTASSKLDPRVASIMASAPQYSASWDTDSSYWF